MRELGVLQRARVERDGARLLTARVGDPPVETPQHRQLRIADRFAKGIRRSPECRGRLGEVVLKQPGLGECGTDGELVLTGERPGTKHRREQLSCFSSASTLECRLRSRERGMNSNRCHGQEYTQYTGWIADVFQP